MSDEPLVNEELLDNNELSVNLRNAKALADAIRELRETVSQMKQEINSLSQTKNSLQADVQRLNQELMILKVGGFGSGPTK